MDRRTSDAPIRYGPDCEEPFVVPAAGAKRHAADPSSARSIFASEGIAGLRAALARKEVLPAVLAAMGVGSVAAAPGKKKRVAGS